MFKSVEDASSGQYASFHLRRKNINFSISPALPLITPLAVLWQRFRYIIGNNTAKSGSNGILGLSQQLNKSNESEPGHYGQVRRKDSQPNKLLTVLTQIYSCTGMD
jgi:hypothetical protein